MAAPTDSGYGLGDHEDKTVGIDEVERQGPKIVSGLAAEPLIAPDSKNGSEACPEGAESDYYGEVQVAKKPRIENGGTEFAAVVDDDDDDDDDSGYGVGTDEGIVEKDEVEHDPLVAGHNGAAETEDRNGEQGDEEDDFENGVVGAPEDESTEDGAAVTGKDTAPGDVGLRTLIQEGDKPSILHHADLDDASHNVNGAK